MKSIALEVSRQFRGDSESLRQSIPLRDKRGSLQFLVRNRAEGTSRRVAPGPFATRWQLRTLIGTPELMLQFAHWLAARERAAGAGADDVEVRAIARVRLNGRPAQPLVNPRVDLAHEPRRLGHYPWIMPAPGDRD